MTFCVARKWPRVRAIQNYLQMEFSSFAMYGGFAAGPVSVRRGAEAPAD